MTDPYAGFPEGFFRRDDERPDEVFYGPPRLVTHIDDAAIAAVGGLYAELGIDGSAPRPQRVLDLMSSWISHFRTPPAELVVLGMNAAELAANPRLARWFTQDLNADPTLPLEDASVDAVTVCVSVQYLQDPVAVFREVARVLRPGGVVAITFSNRCFPTKAVAIWQALGGEDQCRLVSLYLQRAGFAEVEARALLRGDRSDPLWAVTGRMAGV